MQIWLDKLATLPAGFIRLEQAGTFESWVVCKSQLQTATKVVNGSGVLIKGRDGGVVKNPAIAIQTRMLHELRKLEATLRMNDVDYIRSRVVSPKPWLVKKERGRA